MCAFRRSKHLCGTKPTLHTYICEKALRATVSLKYFLVLPANGVLMPEAEITSSRERNPTQMANEASPNHGAAMNDLSALIQSSPHEKAVDSKKEKNGSVIEESMIESIPPPLGQLGGPLKLTRLREPTRDLYASLHS